MKRRKLNLKGRREGTFVLITHAMIDAPAWRLLSPVARALYVEVRRRFHGSNNGQIGLSCRQAAELLSCTKNTAQKAFIELILHGFIKSAKEAIFAIRHSREWELTCEASSKGGPTNEWREFPNIKVENEYLMRDRNKLFRKKKYVSFFERSVSKKGTDSSG